MKIFIAVALLSSVAIGQSQKKQAVDYDVLAKKYGGTSHKNPDVLPADFFDKQQAKQIANCSVLFNNGVVATFTSLDELNSMRDDISACVIVNETRFTKKALADAFYAHEHLSKLIEEKKVDALIAAYNENKDAENASLADDKNRIDALSKSLEQQRTLYNNLVQNYSNLWQQANAAIDKAFAQPQPNAWQRFADGFSQNMQTYYANQPQHIYVHEDVQTKPINCTSTVIGGTVQTNCY